MLVPELGSTIAVMAAALPNLKPRERLVVEHVIAAPNSIPGMSASDLGAASGTSAATVIRACQSVGLKGFQHLRTLLVRDAGAAAAVDFEPNTSISGVARDASKQLIEMSRILEAAVHQLDAEALERAVDTLANATRVVVVGSGSSAASLQSLYLRATFSGLLWEAPTDPVVQALTCRLLSDTDVCLAISDSGMSHATLVAAEAARKSGASVVAVTGYARSTLAETADITITAGAMGDIGGQTSLGANIIQMIVANALQLEVAKRRSTHDRARALASEEILDSIAPDAEPLE